MSIESTILRAYALASQGNYAEAEALLLSNEDVTKTAHGADLYARILNVSGRSESALRIWEELLLADPQNIAAKNAIKCISAKSNSKRFLCASPLVHRLVCGAVAAVLFGAVFSLGKACGTCSDRKQETFVSDTRSTTQDVVINGRITGKTLSDLRDGFLTNLTNTAILVVKGGDGRYITDRQRKLAVVAECISSVAGIPMSQIYFQPAELSVDTVTLSIVEVGCHKESSSK